MKISIDCILCRNRPAGFLKPMFMKCFIDLCYYEFQQTLDEEETRKSMHSGEPWLEPLFSCTLKYSQWHFE